MISSNKGPIASMLINNVDDQVNYLLDQGDIYSMATGIEIGMAYISRLYDKYLYRILSQDTVDRVLNLVPIYGTKSRPVINLLHLARAGFRVRSQSDIISQFRRAHSRVCIN